MFLLLISIMEKKRFCGNAVNSAWLFKKYKYPTVELLNPQKERTCRHEEMGLFFFLFGVVVPEDKESRIQLEKGKT